MWPCYYKKFEGRKKKKLEKDSWKRYEEFRKSYNKFIKSTCLDDKQIKLLNDLLNKKENFAFSLSKNLTPS